MTTRYKDTLAHFPAMQELLDVLQHRTPTRSRARPTGAAVRRASSSTNSEHMAPDLVAHQIRGAAACAAAAPLIAHALAHGWPLHAERVTCPVRVVWGTEDQLLPWPSAAARYQRDLPHADWVELDGIGHCPQLDVPLETAQLILGFTAP